MNKHILWILSIIVLLISSCEEDQDPAGQRGANTSLVVPKILNITQAFFDLNDLDNAYVEFEVGVSDGFSADELVLQVSFNGDLSRQEIERTTELPKTFRVNAADIAQELGMELSDLKLGDIFTFEVLTVNGGQETRSNVVMNARLACSFDPTVAIGEYHVVSADWEVEGDVTIEADPIDPYKVYVIGMYEMEGGVPNNNKFELNIDPTTFAVSGPKSQIGPSAPWGSYTNYYYEPGSGGIFTTCEGGYEIPLTITVDEGSFGLYTFVFTRKDN